MAFCCTSVGGGWGDFVSESGNLWRFFEHAILIGRVVDLVEGPGLLGVRQAGELTIGCGTFVPAVPRPSGARVRRHRTALLKHRDTPRYSPRYITLHTVLEHVTSHHVTHRGTPRYASRCTTLHTVIHNATHRVTQRYITPRYTPRYITLHTVLHHVTSHHVTHRVTPRYIITHRVTPRYTPCYTTLHTCYTMFHTVIHHVTHRVTPRYTS